MNNVNIVKEILSAWLNMAEMVVIWIGLIAIYSHIKGCTMHHTTREIILRMIVICRRIRRHTAFKTLTTVCKGIANSWLGRHIRGHIGI